MKGGKVLEQGTHQELLEKNGYYAGLVKSQLTEEDLATKEMNYDRLSKKKSSIQNDMQTLSSQYSEILSESMKLETEEIKDEEVKIERGKLFELLADHKMDILLGTLGGFIYSFILKFFFF